MADATHVYGPAIPPKSPLPPCGCVGPEWLDPGDSRAGCANCGHCIARELCCAGPPASPHWPAWLAARRAAEVERVAADLALEAAEAARRIDQHRKDAGHRRSVEHAVRIAAKSDFRDYTIRGSAHRVANSSAVDAARTRCEAADRRVAELDAECCMCAAGWRCALDYWRAQAMQDPAWEAAQVATQNALDAWEAGAKGGGAGSKVVSTDLHRMWALEDARAHERVTRLSLVEKYRLQDCTFGQGE